MTTRVPDLEGLLAALVLAPNAFARNRFHALFTDPGARRVRRRASNLRAIARQLAQGDATAPTTLADDGVRRRLQYRVARLDLVRTVTLDAFEVAVLQLAVHRATAGRAPVDDASRTTVEAALARLGPTAHDAHAPSSPLPMDP